MFDESYIFFLLFILEKIFWVKLDIQRYHGHYLLGLKSLSESKVFFSKTCFVACFYAFIIFYLYFLLFYFFRLLSFFTYYSFILSLPLHFCIDYNLFISIEFCLIQLRLKAVIQWIEIDCKPTLTRSGNEEFPPALIEDIYFQYVFSLIVIT